jgi:integrase
MASLKQLPSGAYQARQRIPKDVAAEYHRLYGQRLEAKLHIPAGTKAAEAKQRQAEWVAEVQGRFKAIRAALKGEGQSLTPYETRKLAGEWYLWWTERHRDEPAIQGELWRDQVQSAFQDAAGPQLEGGANPEDLWERNEDARRAVRAVLADIGETAQFFASRGLVLDNAARTSFLDWLYEDLAAAIRLIVRRAGGNHSPDAYRERFPLSALVDVGLSPWELFERWVSERQPAAGTVENWRSYFRALQDKFPNGAIAPSDAELWVKALPTRTLSVNAVRSTWLKAFRTVFNWAVRHKLVAVNPFSGIELTVRKKATLRETKAFRADEAALILKAALSISDTTAPDDAAKRWVPWLCAYTGARPAEITQLRKQDVFKGEGGIWALKLTPEAGTIKSKQVRLVPLHEHLLEQGFLAFVDSRSSGPLFYRPRPASPEAKGTSVRKSPAAQVRQRLAGWVRSLGVTDAELSPNHAWRHSFKQIADRYNISEKVSDHITGHSSRSVARGYGAPTLEDMAEALKKFPRYMA